MSADDGAASARTSARGGALPGGAPAQGEGMAVSAPGAAHADAASQAGTRVDFYVIQTDSARERLRTACRVVEKAYLAGHTVLVWHTDVEELREFDDLLWTFSDGSFVPHEAITAAGFAAAPVLLASSATPPGGFDVLVNLAPEVPACVAETRRVAEFIDGDPVRRQAGRARFRSYKDRGWSPTTHNL
jgi:DNA polymerase-3 subunit chi